MEVKRIINVQYQLLFMIYFILLFSTVYSKPINENGGISKSAGSEDLESAECGVFLIKFRQPRNRLKRNVDNLDLPPMGEFSGSEYRQFNRANVIYVPFYHIRRVWSQKDENNSN